MKRSKYKIALFGHRLDSSNLGVDALTQSHLSILQSEAIRLNVDFEIDIFAGKKVLAVVEYSNNMILRQLPSPVIPKRIFANILQIPHSFKDYIAVFDLSEGDSFADIYGWRRAYINSMQRILAARAGCPVVVAPMTIGPFNHSFWRRFAAKALDISCVVFARDEKSVGVARELGCDRVQLATDLAMALPFERSNCSLNDQNKIHVGVNVSGLLWSGGYTGKNEFGIKADYGSTMTAIIQRLTSDPSIQVHLVPHVLSTEPVEDDRVPSQILREQFSSCLIAPSFGGSIAAKNYISGLDFFMGSRMHACIAAFSSGVPTLPLAYCMKFEGLFGSLGYRRTVDLCSASQEQILSALERALVERDEIKEEVMESFAKASDLLGQYGRAVGAVLEQAIS